MENDSSAASSNGYRTGSESGSPGPATPCTVTRGSEADDRPRYDGRPHDHREAGRVLLPPEHAFAAEGEAREKETAGEKRERSKTALRLLQTSMSFLKPLQTWPPRRRFLLIKRNINGTLSVYDLQ